MVVCTVTVALVRKVQHVFAKGKFMLHELYVSSCLHIALWSPGRGEREGPRPPSKRLAVPRVSPDQEVCLTSCSVAQSCRTLCDPVDGGRPGSSVHGILQTRILEWVAISFSTDQGEALRNPNIQESP